MAADIVVEMIVKGIIEIFGGFFYKLLFLWPGWLFLKLITLGKHPTDEYYKNKEWAVALVGISVLIALGVIAYFRAKSA